MQKFQLTSLGKLFLTIGILLYLAMATSRSGLLLFPLSVLLGCLAVDFLMLRKFKGAVVLEVPKYELIPEGARLPSGWKLKLGARRSDIGVTINWLGRSIYEASTIEAGEIANVYPDLSWLPRGLYDLRSLSAVFHGAFGFVNLKVFPKTEGEFVVHPALFHTHPPRSSGHESVVGGKSKSQKLTNSGTHFAGVRPLQSGDSFKQIHWKTSAKGSGLMVKQFEEELAGRVSILTDCWRSEQIEILDDALRASASLIIASMEAGDHLDWAPLGKKEEIVPVAPFSDPAVILDKFARITGTKEKLELGLVVEFAEKVHRKSALCLVLQEAYPWLVDFVSWSAGRNRKLSIYLPLSKNPTAVAGASVFYYHARGIIEA